LPLLWSHRLYRTMDSPPKLSGETLIVHHIPLVHCQVSGGRQSGCGASLKRSNPFSPPENLGLSRTTSLPERDVLQREALLYSSLIQTSGGAWSSHNGGRERKGGGRGGSTASDDSSDTNSALDDGMTSFHLHDLGFASEPFILHSSVVGGSRESLRGVASDLSNNLQNQDIIGLDGQRRHGSSGSNMSMDCGEHDWGDDEEDEYHPMRCGRTLSECQQDYGSDSSCNSSDGVLVNFSAIYNKLNNSIPEKPPVSGHTNLNTSTDHSFTSSVSDPPGNQQDSTTGAFYLDLHTSPTEPPLLHQESSCLAGTFPLIREPHLSTSSTCSCAVEHKNAFDLDANCNAYHPLHSGSSGDLASCLQSQARLVVATQNYYKLVTCDLSSQTSPSPAGSSVNSCSDEHSKSSPTPTQPSEYFLFRQPDEEEEEEKEKKKNQQAAAGTEPSPAVIEGQVYVNISPPTVGRGAVGGGASSGSRPRSRSYDRNLDKSPSPRLGSLERMLSCPVRLSEGTAPSPPPPPRVTSFAEIARSKRRNGGAVGSPSLKSAADPFSSTYSTHSHSSVDFSPILEQHVEVDCENSSPAPFTRCYSQGSIDLHLEGARESRAKAEGTPLSLNGFMCKRTIIGCYLNFLYSNTSLLNLTVRDVTPPSCLRPGGLSSSSDSRSTVVRYRKDQRPTSLPIQPFTFQHQFASKPPQPKPLLPLITGYVSGMQARSSSSSGSDCGGPVGEDGEDAAENMHRYQGTLAAAAPPPGTVRPSPLGSYSPVRLQGAPNSSTCSTCTLSPRPAHSLSCPLSAGLSPTHSPPTGNQGQATAQLPSTPPPPSLGVKRGMVPPMLPAVDGHCFHPGALATHHLSPQALKWREYRRRNPLGVERNPGGHTGTLEHRGGLLRPPRRNVFDFPAAFSGQTLGRLNGQSYNDFQPDYFSLTEKPPEEFCLSPDASTSSFSCLVKAVNTAVDLIVAHFGTSRDPDVKAKLGNSWVSPNVGHLILKYLCPALHEVLQDGLKAYVLDLIIGQRRCQPWSLVEASTQLGPSTRVLHSLFSKVSQYSELTNHSMRLNAFIFGLLNLKSLEFWFNHLYTHEDVLAAHYNPWGFLPLSQGACQPLFEELLLLLQPLSLLPFDLNVLFEPHLLQKGQEQLRRKEQLCSVGQSATQSTRSTFQLMRGWSRRGEEGEGFSNMWKERVMGGERVNGVGQDRQGEGEDGHEKDRMKEKENDEGRQRQDRQASWWYQLMQSSQVYIDRSTEGSKFVKAEKRKKSSERRHGQLPPAREGVLEGADGVCAGSRVRPSWMGSPPESILNQERESKALTSSGTEAQEEHPSQGLSLRWGRLFGATVGSPSRGEGSEQRAKASTARPPSGWLSLDRSVLDLVAQTIGAGSGKKTEPPATPTHTQAMPPPRSAQTTEAKTW
uniref:RUN domain-containing protein n=1 Tax=Mola mola TaxID=94237 RepID=A0A3Q3X9W5_MOLML